MHRIDILGTLDGDSDNPVPGTSLNVEREVIGEEGNAADPEQVGV